MGEIIICPRETNLTEIVDKDNYFPLKDYFAYKSSIYYFRDYIQCLPESLEVRVNNVVKYQWHDELKNVYSKNSDHDVIVQKGEDEYDFFNAYYWKTIEEKHDSKLSMDMLEGDRYYNYYYTLRFDIK